VIATGVATGKEKASKQQPGTKGRGKQAHQLKRNSPSSAAIRRREGVLGLKGSADEWLSEGGADHRSGGKSVGFAMRESGQGGGGRLQDGFEEIVAFPHKRVLLPLAIEGGSKG